MARDGGSVQRRSRAVCRVAPRAAILGGMKADAGRVLGTIWVWFAWGMIVLVWTPAVVLLWLLTAWWDRPRWYVSRFFRLCARAAVAVNPLWSVHFRGTLPPERGRAHVVVSNHVSLADVALIGSIPWEMKWISKSANFWIPFLGLMMWLAGDVYVKRDDRESRSRAYDRLKTWIERGSSVIVFPEGTRSRTGEMLPFRNGPFRLAIETRAPVLPMAVHGTRRAIEKGSLFFGRASAQVAVLDPIPVEDLGMDDVEELRDEVRRRIQRAREELAAELGDDVAG